MSLDFLTLTQDGPLARSPLAELSQEGAAIEPRDGWETVASYGDPAGEDRACRTTVGWADVSALPKRELNGGSAWLAELEPGLAGRRDSGWVCPLTPRRGLLLGETGDPPDGFVIDLTSSLAAIAILGPEARETIARFCAIDTREASLPSGGFRPGSVARTPGYLLREGADRFLLLVGAALGLYVWRVVADAGARRGGRPVGPASLDRSGVVPQEVGADA